MSAGARTLVVSGASGHLGRRTIELLLESRAGLVIAVTRTPEKLADLSQRGAIVRRGDFDDPASLDHAFAGGERLLLVSTDTFDRPGHRVQQHVNAIAAARRAGMRHIAYTSFASPVAGSPVAVADDHRLTEEAVMRSGLGWTFLRNNLYADDLLATLSAAIAAGQLLDATGGTGAAYVTREDCARAAAAVLAAPSFENRELDITGPAVVTFAALARMVSDVFGAHVEHRPTDTNGLKRAMVEGGTPDRVADVLVSFQQGMARGLFAPASKVVEKLTGRAPMSVEKFLAANREAMLAMR